MDESVSRGPWAGLPHRWTRVASNMDRPGTAHAWEAGHGVGGPSGSESQVCLGAGSRQWGQAGVTVALPAWPWSQAEQSFLDNGCVPKPALISPGSVWAHRMLGRLKAKLQQYL